MIFGARQYDWSDPDFEMVGFSKQGTKKTVMSCEELQKQVSVCSYLQNSHRLLGIAIWARNSQK